MLGLGALRVHAQTPTVTIFGSSNDGGVPVFCGVGSDILVSGRVAPVNAATLGGFLTAQVIMAMDYSGTEQEFDSESPSTLLVPQIVSFNSSLGLFTYRVFFANHAENAIVRYRVNYTMVDGTVVSGEFQTANFDVAFDVPAFAGGLPTCANPVVLDGAGTALPAGFPIENVTYSGPGVGINLDGETVFNPNAAGVGTHVVTFGGVYRGCSIFKSISVTVTQTPEPQIIGAPGTVCKLAEDEIRVGLRLSPLYIDETDSPFNADIQTTEGVQPLTVEIVEGTDSVYVIIPATSNSGTVRLSYQYLAGTCNAQTIDEFIVNEVANLNLGIISPSVANLNETLCFVAGGNNTLRLEGVPGAGLFESISGPQATIVPAGVGVDFTPSDPGNYRVRYSVMNSNCLFVVEQTLSYVAPAFPANFLNVADLTQFCISNNEQTLNFGLSNPGEGNEGRVFDEEGSETVYDGSATYAYTFSLSPARTIVLVYEVNEATGCVTRDTIRIRIQNGIVADVNYPTLNKPALSDTFCKDMNLQIPLQVTPSGGTITPQIIGGQQVIVNIGGTWYLQPRVTGQHVFLYSGFQDNCQFNRIFIVTVLDPDNIGPVAISTAGGQTTFSVGQGAVQLIGSPAGGVFSGTGVFGNTFNPTIAGVGTFNLTYTLTQGGCDASASITVTVNDGSNPPCTSPANYTALPSANGATLVWDAVPGAVSYQVRYRRLGTTVWIFRNVSATFSSLSLTGLETATTYEYQIRTTCSGNVISTFGPTRTFTTGTSATCLPPATLSVESVSSNSAIIEFSSPQGGAAPADYDVVLRFGAGPNAGQIAPNGQVSINAGESLSYEFSGLQPNTSYIVEVRTNCVGVSSSEVRTETFATLPDFTVCPAPTGLIVNATSETTAIATWNAVPVDVADYVFDLTGGPGSVTYTPGATTAALTGLNAGTTYTFSVRTLCGFGESAAAAFTFTTPGTGANCSGLTPSISSISLQSTQATVRWGRIQGATSYRLEYRLFGTSAFTTVSVAATAELTQFHPLTGLTPGTRYEVRVTAVCPGGNSPASVIRRFVTLSAGKFGETELTFDDNVSVYPNPSRGLFNIAFNAAWESQVQVSLFDLTGRNVLNQSFSVVEGHNVVDVDATRLGAGLYVLKFDSDGHTQTVKVSIQ